MNDQLELIKKLYAVKKIYKVPEKQREGVEQVELQIKPLSLEDLGLLNMQEGMPLSETAKNVKIMISKSLEISEEEAGKISFSFMEDLINAIMDVNDFKDEDLKKTGIKEFIKNKNEQSANEKK